MPFPEIGTNKLAYIFKSVVVRRNKNINVRIEFRIQASIKGFQ